MPDAIESASNNREILANRPDLLALLKATAASKADEAQQRFALKANWLHCGRYRSVRLLLPQLREQLAPDCGA